MPLTVAGGRGFLSGVWSYLSLHTGEVPTPENELDGAGYARAALTWEGSDSGVIVTNPPVFPVATSAWQEVFSIAIRDSQLGDAEFMAYVGLARGIKTDAGRRPVIARDFLELGLGDAGGTLHKAGFPLVYDYELVRGTWLSLHTADPGRNGDHEQTGAGYARVQLSAAAPYDMVLSDAPQAAYVSARRVEFARATGAWTTVTHAALWSRQVGGDILYSFQLASAVMSPREESLLYFDEGELVIDFTGSLYTVLPERATQLVTDTPPLDVSAPEEESRTQAPSRRLVAKELADRTPRNDTETRALIREVMGQVLRPGTGIVIQPQVDGSLLIAEAGHAGPGPTVTSYVADGLNADFTASELAAGVTSTTRTLTLPAWPADEERYLALAYPTSEGPLRSIIYGGGAINQLASWERLADLRIRDVDCHVYRLYGEATDVLSGIDIHLGF